MMSATNAQLLPPGLLRDLQSLNLRFLDVLCRAARENDGAAAVHGLPATLAVRLAELDEGPGPASVDEMCRMAAELEEANQSAEAANFKKLCVLVFRTSNSPSPLWG